MLGTEHGRKKWIARGAAMTRAHSAFHWDLADWAVEGTDVHGVDPERAADEIGVPPGTLRPAAACARRWPPGTRFDALTIWHHQEVLGLDREAADRLLMQASGGGWSVNRLRREVQAEKGSVKPHQLELELVADGQAWGRDARRVDRLVRRHLRRADLEIEAALGAVENLADHPGLPLAHGNAVRASALRLREQEAWLPDARRGDLRRLVDRIHPAAGQAPVVMSACGAGSDPDTRAALVDLAKAAAAGPGPPAGDPSAGAGRPPAAAADKEGGPS